MAAPFRFPFLSDKDVEINEDNNNNWFRKVLNPLNILFSYVGDAFDKNITFDENIDCQLAELTFTTPSTYAAGGWNIIRFQRSLERRLFGISLVKIELANNAVTAIKGDVNITSWYESNKEVRITWISGLSADTTYKIRVLAF